MCSVGMEMSLPFQMGGCGDHSYRWALNSFKCLNIHEKVKRQQVNANTTVVTRTLVFSSSFLPQERETRQLQIQEIFQYPISAPCHCNTIGFIPAHRKIKQDLKMILLMDRHLKICEIQSPHQSFTIIIFYIFYKRK